MVELLYNQKIWQSVYFSLLQLCWRKGDFLLYRVEGLFSLFIITMWKVSIWTERQKYPFLINCGTRICEIICEVKFSSVPVFSEKKKVRKGGIFLIFKMLPLLCDERINCEMSSRSWHAETRRRNNIMQFAAITFTLTFYAR